MLDLLIKTIAQILYKKQKKWSSKPVETQEKVFRSLIKTLAQTKFGKDHKIDPNDNYAAFKSKIKISDYEGMKSYFDRTANGEENVLWKGVPIYLAKTSGTTSGSKFVPITKDSIGNHMNSARNALVNYIANTGNSSFLKGKVMFLSGSPVLEKKAGIPTGRLSGIVNHHVPKYLKNNQMPSWEINCIEDWETKVKEVAKETLSKDMRLISGIPPWVQMYFDRITKETGKKIKDVFPNFSVMVYGGVNYEPYKAKLEESIGKPIDGVEVFPASEGFFAYQYKPNQKGLLLLLNEGIFYEFIPADNYFDDNPPRLSIKDVELNVNYALIINSNAGLWAYSIGDTIKFISKDPYQVLVTGRIKHFISAFGEHVIGEEVDRAIQKLVSKYALQVTEFTVAPQVNPEHGLPYHEWLIEGEMPKERKDDFMLELNQKMCEQNSYYKDLIEGSVLKGLQVVWLPQGSFTKYMKSIGKLGGQNKVPRLANDRKIADCLISNRIT
tara:strand:+ start:2127 stop:3617 length:1491 start_codon:yes stop_codon:yes gene_type:complete